MTLEIIIGNLMFEKERNGEFEQMNGKVSPGRFLEKNLVSRIAWLYFIKGFTQHEISKRLNISRMQVQRSISKSKKEGLVQIKIVDPLTSCFELEEDIKSRFSLSNAIVTPSPDDKDGIKRALGKATAEFLLRYLKDGQIIGIGHGTTLRETIKVINPRKLPNSKVISLIGGGIRRTKEDPYEVASNFADALNCPCYYISAPAIADSLESGSVIASEKMVNYTLQIAKRSDLAVLGIGIADKDSTLVKAGFLSPADVSQLKKNGAVGDICAQFYNSEGQPVDYGYAGRVIGLNLQDLKKIKTVIGVAGAKKKIAAISAALKGRLIDILITDKNTAKRLLS